MTIYHHPRFARSFKHLDPHIRKAAEKRVALFRRNPLNSRLRTHPLHGKLKHQWSFSVDARTRILFEFTNQEQTEVIFLDIGSHALYQ